MDLKGLYWHWNMPRYRSWGIRGVKTVEGNDESLYCHGNLIIPLIKRGMMSDYAHVNHASVSVHNH